MLKKEYFRYLLATFLVLAVLAASFKTGIQNLFYSVKFTDILISISICWVIFSISGLRLSCASKLMYGITLTLWDIVSLPVVMSLWGYILPLKGGLVYFVFYMKEKYRINLVKSAGISIYTYIITISMVGFIVLFLSCLLKPFNIYIFLVGLGVSFNYFILFFAKKTVIWIGRGKPPGFVNKLIALLTSILRDLNNAMLSKKLLIISVILSIIHIGLTVLWFAAAAQALNLEMSLLSLIFLVLASQISAIFRIVPGNLGVSEFIMGATTALIDGAVEEGLAIALFVRATGLALTIILGGLVASHHISKFEFVSFHSFARFLKKE